MSPITRPTTYADVSGCSANCPNPRRAGMGAILLLITSFGAGCNDKTMTSSHDSGRSGDALAAARRKAAEEALPATKEIRSSEVRRLIEQLRKRLPAAQFAALNNVLSDESSGIALGVDGDALATYLVARIYVLRDADRLEQQQAGMRLAGGQHEAPLRIVVTESVAGEKLVGRLRRTARGENTLLLAGSDLTPANLVSAVRALAISRKQHGEIPTSTITLNLRRQGMPRGRQGIVETETWAAEIISRLQRSERKVLPGVGPARELTVNVKPVVSGSVSP